MYYISFRAIGNYYTVSVFDITTHNICSNYNNYYILFEIIILCLELRDSQTLLMIEKKASLAKTQQITDLKEKLKLTSTLSSGLY